MNLLIGNPNIVWDNNIREIRDDGDHFEKIDVVHQELLDKVCYLKKNTLTSVSTVFHGSGKAVGTYTLPLNVPDKAIVVGMFHDVITTFTSADNTATMSLGLVSAGDIISDSLVNDSPWKQGLEVGYFSLTDAVKIVADPVVVTGQIIGIGNGTKDHFALRCIFPPGDITPSTVTINSLDGTGNPISLTDDGSGNLDGGQGSGTINYSTGEIDVTFTTVPGNMQNITADFTYVPNPGPGKNLIVDVKVQALLTGKAVFFVWYVISE